MDEKQTGGDDLVRAFARWAADQRVAEAAASRSRERSLRYQAGASATWAGVLVDLAEQGATVVATLPTGRRTGRIVGVGTDFFVMQPSRGRPALVALSAVASVTVASDGPATGPALAPAGDRAPAIELSLATALGGLADERAPVGLCLRGLRAGEVLDGSLIAAGQDVLTVRCAARVLYVPLDAVLVCELR